MAVVQGQPGTDQGLAHNGRVCQDSVPTHLKHPGGGRPVSATSTPADITSHLLSRRSRDLLQSDSAAACTSVRGQAARGAEWQSP
jgi:hypothetical protein